MKNLLFLITILASTTFIFAQETYSCANPHPQDVINAQNAIAVNGNLTDYNYRFAASQAINFKDNNTIAGFGKLPEFELATVSVLGSESKFLARFNPISNEIEIKGKNDSKIYNLVKLDGVLVKFNKNGQDYKSVSYVNSNGETAIDYFKLSQKNPNLLIKNKYKFKKAKIATTSYDVSKPSKYVKSEHYFYVDHADNLVELSAKRKSIKKHLKPYKEEILAFVKDNNIDSNENDLAKLVNYIKHLEFKSNINGSLASTNN